ncbi:hypothetical protein [Pseudarthrobacter sp. H2]|uniref:hypothetical protein n=1 Tax=Pseudarthrobacter sp. H2 TaxID=3418415 RepID=UPI003CF7116C
MQLALFVVRNPPLIPTPGMQAVDEALPNYFCVHKVSLVFPQVSDGLSAEVFFYPQLFAQAVHKQEALVHSFSTGGGAGRVGAGRIRG